MNNMIYHPAIESLSNDLQLKGGITIDKDNKRHKTLNPDWYNNKAFQVMSVKGDRLLETTPSVQKIHDAMDAYLDPIKHATKAQTRILEALHNTALDLEIESDYMGSFDVEELYSDIEIDNTIENDYEFDSDPELGFTECNASDIWDDIDTSDDIVIVQCEVTFSNNDIDDTNSISKSPLHYNRNYNYNNCNRTKLKHYTQLLSYNLTNPQYNTNRSPARNLRYYSLDPLFSNAFLFYVLSKGYMVLIVSFIVYTLSLIKRTINSLFDYLLYIIKCKLIIVHELHLLLPVIA